MSTSNVRGLGQMLVGNVLATAAARYPEREAIHCSGTGRRLSFRLINERTNRLAHALTGLGLRKGEVVGFMCSNRAEAVEIYFALAKTGLVGLPVNYRLAPREVVTLLEAVRARTLIGEARFAETLRWVRREVRGIEHFIHIGASAHGIEGHAGASPEREAPAGYLEYEALLREMPAHEPESELCETDPYYFNLTSGTTGVPKTYLLNHYNSCSVWAATPFGVRSEDVILTVFPVFGRVGFSWVGKAFMCGARTVLADFAAGQVLRLIGAERVSFTMLVPTMAAMLLGAAELGACDLSSLRGVAFAGAMLPPRIRDETMARLCPNLYEGYGLQEVGWLAISTPAERRRRPDSVGLPVLFSEVRLIDAAGHRVAAGEIGEIIARAPCATTEYFESPARSAEAFRDGWFHTGDLGRLDADGCLFICGRVKDMIISGGQNVHSAEVEAVLLELPGVVECAVVGLPHAIWGESVAAVVVRDESPAVGLEAVQAFCREHLAGFKVPRQLIERREPLPRTPTGKVQKFLLIEQYAREERADTRAQAR